SRRGGVLRGCCWSRRDRLQTAVKRWAMSVPEQLGRERRRGGPVKQQLDHHICSRFGALPASSSSGSGSSYDPASVCSMMRRACASNFDGTKSSLGPVGYGLSRSPSRWTGIPSASSRPLVSSASTQDCVKNTDTRSSSTDRPCHAVPPSELAGSRCRQAPTVVLGQVEA